MFKHINLTPRDRSMLRLLSWTPATSSLILRASNSFEGEPTGNERRVRERLQSLIKGGLVRSWSTAHAGGGLQNYYKLTPSGFQCLFDDETELPPRSFFAEVSPTFFVHTFRIAEVIVEILRSAHQKQITIERIYRENELSMAAGDEAVQPDCFIRFKAGGRAFNVAFEIDGSTESIESHASNSVKRKIAIYQRYQENVLSQWVHGGKGWERPRFRVVFLTLSVERVYHILSHSAATAEPRSRRLVYGTTHTEFVRADDPLCSPILLDHFGDWRSLIDLHPTSAIQRARVKFPKQVESIF